MALPEGIIRDQKWIKQCKRSDFRLYDHRPLDGKITYGEPLEFNIGFEPMIAVNLYTITKMELDAKTFFPVFYNGGFVGTLEPNGFTRKTMLAHKDTCGFVMTAECVGVRYANTHELQFRVRDITPGDPWTQPNPGQDDPIAYLNELREMECAPAPKDKEGRKGWLSRFFA